MPHVILHHSDLDALGLTPERLVDAVFHGMEASELFDPNDIKVRVVPVSHYRNGRNNYSFIHTEARIMPGRTPAQKAAMSDLVLSAVQALDTPVASITVEVSDIDRACYAKAVTQESGVTLKA